MKSDKNNAEICINADNNGIEIEVTDENRETVLKALGIVSEGKREKRWRITICVLSACAVFFVIYATFNWNTLAQGIDMSFKNIALHVIIVIAYVFGASKIVRLK